MGGFIGKLEQFCIELQQHQCQGGCKFDAERLVFHSTAAMNEEGLINTTS